MKPVEYNALTPDARSVLDELVRASGGNVVSGLHVLVNGRDVDLDVFAKAIDKVFGALKFSMSKSLMHFTQVKNAGDVEHYLEHNPAAPFKAAWLDMLMDVEVYGMFYSTENYIDEAYRHV